MTKQDLYKLLGVDRSVDATTLKKSYRKLAMKYHPDRNPGDKEAEHKFKELSEAYEILKDDQKRAAYDQYGHAAFEQGGHGGHHPGAGGFSGRNFSDIFDEMFSEFTGGRQHRAEVNLRGSDMRYNLSISLEEAFKGKTKKIRFTAAAGCKTCQETGSADGSAPKTCDVCHGHGMVRTQQGFFTIERPCSACQGVGQKVSNPCKSCNGTGRTHSERTLEVKIPAGVGEGTRIRLTGEGEVGVRGAPSGDLYVFLSIKNHKFFKRQEADLYCHVPIPMTTAALGGEIEVPSIDGSRTKVKIPAGTQSGKHFRLRAKGMTIHRSTRRGDFYIEAAVETPQNLNKRQKELLQEFEASGKHESTSPAASGFFTRVKDFLNDLGKSAGVL